MGTKHDTATGPLSQLPQGAKHNKFTFWGHLKRDQIWEANRSKARLWATELFTRIVGFSVAVNGVGFWPSQVSILLA